MTTPSNARPRLRFLACGSVDDGKSTLLGRLLFESSALYDDQRADLLRNAASHGGTVDYSLLFDGLLAERAQKITEDVAHRFFSTANRSFIVQDTPGHEEYTRNMATAATKAELAVLLVDARHGILEQTKRHAFISALFGVRHFLLAVNKIDLVDYSEARYYEIVNNFKKLVTELNLSTWDAMPLSALQGDNVVVPSARTPWYTGPSLLSYLEAFKSSDSLVKSEVCLPIQLVLGASAYTRVYMGTLSHAELRKGARIYAAPSGESSEIRDLWCSGSPAECAPPGSAVSFTLTRPIDLRRGDVLSTTPLPCSHSINVTLIVLGTQTLKPGQNVIVRIATSEQPAQIQQIHTRMNLETLQSEKATSLSPRDIGQATLQTAAPCVCAPYSHSKTLGAMILIDPLTDETLAAGICITTTQENRNTLHYTHKLYVDSPNELPGEGNPESRLASLRRLCAKNDIEVITRWESSQK